MSSVRLLTSSSSWLALDFWALMAELYLFTSICRRHSSRNVNEAARRNAQMSLVER